MELIIKEVKFFISALQSIENVDYECKIIFDKTGIQIMGMDGSRISLFDFKMGEIETGEYFGMNLADFGKILERIKSAKELRLILDKKMREIKIKAKLKDKTKTFSLREIDTNIEKIPLDSLLSLPYLKVFRMSTDELIGILKDCELYSGTVNIGSKNGILSFWAYGNLGEVLIKKESEDKMPHFLSSYSIKLVESKIKEMRGFEVDMVIGDDLPLYLNYELPNGYLKIFIAPKVEEDL